jgi:hypothetical protein
VGRLTHRWSALAAARLLWLVDCASTGGCPPHPLNSSHRPHPPHQRPNNPNQFRQTKQGVVPARFRHDKQLVSHDEHTSKYNYKYTFSVEIVPVCKVGGLVMIGLVMGGRGWLEVQLQVHL